MYELSRQLGFVFLPKKFEKFRGKGLIDLVSPLKSAVRHRKL